LGTGLVALGFSCPWHGVTLKLPTPAAGLGDFGVRAHPFKEFIYFCFEGGGVAIGYGI
jgi:hypothetical protein